jgi:hypothetical protein
MLIFLGRCILTAWAILGPMSAAELTVDFSNGVPPPSVATVTPLAGGAVDFSGGQMNIAGTNPGDGARFVLNDFSARCVILDNVNFQNFAVGDGLDFFVFDDLTTGEGIGLEVFQADSIVVEVTQVKGGASKILQRIEVPGVNLGNVGKLRLDWIKPEKPGGQIGLKVRSSERTDWDTFRRSSTATFNI